MNDILIDAIGFEHNEFSNEIFNKNFSNDIHCSAELNELGSALSIAQAEIGTPILKNCFLDILEDFGDVIKASRFALVKNGLAVTQLIQRDDVGHKILRTILLHKSGQWVSAYELFGDSEWEEKDPIKYLTFLRMQSYISIIGLVVK